MTKVLGFSIGDKSLGVSTGDGGEATLCGAGGISKGSLESVVPGSGPTGVDEDLVLDAEAISVMDGSSKKASYSEAVRDVLSKTIQPDFVVKDGVGDISIPEELLEDVDPQWKGFVVGCFMNDAPHIGSIHSMVNHIWATPGKVSKIDV